MRSYQSVPHGILRDKFDEKDIINMGLVSRYKNSTKSLNKTADIFINRCNKDLWPEAGVDALLHGNYIYLSALYLLKKHFQRLLLAISTLTMKRSSK